MSDHYSEVMPADYTHAEDIETWQRTAPLILAAKAKAEELNGELTPLERDLLMLLVRGTTNPEHMHNMPGLTIALLDRHKGQAVMAWRDSMAWHNGQLSEGGPRFHMSAALGEMADDFMDALANDAPAESPGAEVLALMAR